MSNDVVTKLDSSSFSFRDLKFVKNDVVELAPGQFFRLKLHWDADISLAARQKLFAAAAQYLRSSFKNHPSINVSRIRSDGFFDADGKLHKPEGTAMQKTQTFWKRAESILKKGRMSVAIPDSKRVDVPEETIHKKGIGTAEFENMPGTHYLDGLPSPAAARPPEEPKTAFIRRCTITQMEKAGKTFDPKRKGTRESLAGVGLSIDPRSNYRMVLRPEGELAAFLGQGKTFTSTEILAKNGKIPGAVSASLDGYADRITLLRSVESEDGSVDVLSGRVFDFETAKEMAAFAFLSQMRLYQDPNQRHLAQGIFENGDEYQFQFAVQSLLPMLFKGRFGGEEIGMVYKEIDAYRKLSLMEIADPADPGKIYKVRIHPLPVAAVQFNSLKRIEALLPRSLSGEHDAREQTDQTDRALFQIAEERLKGRLEGLERAQIADTVYFLQRKETLTQAQEILTRAFLCHLLRIPLVIHCKSCVDRTNIANAMITAMKQWLRARVEIPQVDGKYAVFKLPEVRSGSIHPFKELFAFNLHKGLKISELARGEKGYRYHRGLVQHPALAELLPENYLKEEKKPNFFHRWVVPIAATFLPPFLIQILASAGGNKKIWAPQKRLWNKGVSGKIGAVALSVFLLIPLQLLVWPIAFLSSFRTLSVRKIAETAAWPVKFVANADQLYPEKILNEDHPLVGPRQLLEPEQN